MEKFIFQVKPNFNVIFGNIFYHIFVKLPQASAPAYSMTSRHGIGGFSEDLKKTPGPGTYRPIDPSVYRYRQPSYSMTGRNIQPGDSTRKPGPGAHSPEKGTSPHLFDMLRIFNESSIFFN